MPLQYFFDVRECVARLRLEGTHIEEDELFDLRRSLETICAIVSFLNRPDGTDGDGEPAYAYPALHRLANGVATFPQLVQRIDQILDKFGKIKDSASPALLEIRRELARTEGSISRTLNSILRAAQSEGLVDRDASATMRDGRLVIPVAPGLKRKIRGIVHDESATGKTVYIEPAEVVEANNRVRELEAEERRQPTSHRLDKGHTPVAGAVAGQTGQTGGSTRHHAHPRQAHTAHIGPQRRRKVGVP